MKVVFTGAEIYQVDAGWRDWLFLKIDSNIGIHGYAEFTDSNGATSSLIAAVHEVNRLLVGKEINDTNLIVDALRRRFRQSLPGIMWKAISAVENALWDLLSKVEEEPIQWFFSGRLNSLETLDVKAYWSHCPTTRIRAAEKVGVEPIRTSADLIHFGSEINRLGFNAFKTNLVGLSPDPCVYMPGFNRDFSFDSRPLPNNYGAELREVIDSICKINSNLEAIIDFNFNVGEVEFLEIQKCLSGRKIRWLEIDFDDHFIYDSVLDSKQFPLCTGENVLGLWNYIPIINDDRVDIISIDLIWNGFSESLKIASAAIDKGKRIAVHNYYGGLASSMACVFLEMLPGEVLELVEFDYDDVSWRDAIVTNPITFENGSIKHTNGLGWNNNLILDALDQSLVTKDL